MADQPIGFETMSSALPDAINYHRWLMSLLEPWLRGRVLEVGSGYGQYTVEIARHVQSLRAIDCDAECLARLRGLPGHVDSMVADLSDPDFAQRVGTSSYDAIVCLNVLEHIEGDAQALRALHHALAPGGCLLLIVPAHQALYGPMDAMAGHVRRYGRLDLGSRLEAAGYAVRELRYVNPLGGLGWWVNAKLLRPKNLSAPMVNRQILWFDRYVQPVSRRLDPLTSRWFGQSLWAVGERSRPATGRAES